MLMAPLTRAELNLLQERRQELGLNAQPALVPQVRSLLGKGMGLGALLVLAVVAVAAWLAWQESQQQVVLDRLQPLEQRLRLDQTQLQQLKARTAVIRKENTQIAEQLVAVRASSALMEQLRRLTPQGIQLKEVAVRTQQIKIVGQSLGGGSPGPFERINALVLQLAALPMVKPDGVKVLKVVREGAGEDGEFVQFSVDVTLDPKAKPSLQELSELGASGLVERYRLLEEQGVAP